MSTAYFLGCSGFYYNHWKGLFYPEKIPKTKWLQYYTQYFNTLEVNSTFYRYPSESMLQDWYDKTPKKFQSTPKANRIIIHTYKFHNTQQYTANFYKLAHLLKEKLLCVLFQLPPFIHKNLKLLQKSKANSTQKLPIFWSLGMKAGGTAKFTILWSRRIWFSARFPPQSCHKPL